MEIHNRGILVWLCYTTKYHIMEYLQGNLIARFIMNDCSNQEKQDVLAWITESDHNKATFRHFEQMIGNILHQNN
jgi:hypothetical protein